MHDKYYPDSEYLFPADTDNGTITNRAVYLVYRKICHKLGIEIQKDNIRGPHSFRRNAITDVVNKSKHLFGNYNNCITNISMVQFIYIKETII